MSSNIRQAARSSENEGPEQEGRVTLPRVARSRLAIVFALAVALVGAGGFVAGSLIPRSQASQAFDDATPATVIAPVETRVVTERVSVQAQVSPGAKTEVVISDTTTTNEIPYVTQAGPSAGEEIASGALLVAVAGRPQIALQVMSPLYRDLTVGDEGSDVFAFESALAQTIGGDFDVDTTFTANTMDAADSLWDRLGYELPTAAQSQQPLDATAAATPLPTASAAPVGPVTAPYVDVHEIVQLSGPTANVVANAKLGDLAKADAPVATIVGPNAHIGGRVTVVNESLLTVGAEVMLTAPGVADEIGTVQMLGDFELPTEGDEDETAATTAGRDFDVTLPESWKSLPAGTPVQVSPTSEGTPVLAVPLVAIRGAATDPHVIVEESQSFPPGATVAVKVLDTGDGWVQINEDAGLVGGDRLRLAP